MTKGKIRITHHVLRTNNRIHNRKKQNKNETKIVGLENHVCELFLMVFSFKNQSHNEEFSCCNMLITDSLFMDKQQEN